ncbi:MAG: DUF4372 domain-containing protein [Treponema sp.]|nr:DUF4372 domain-containing protein [Treponema sp.]
MFSPQKHIKQGVILYRAATISAQLLPPADRPGFEKICYQEKINKRYHHFTARRKFYAMMVALLTNQFRGIENAIASDNDLYHAGMRSNITRTNLAHANERHHCEVFHKFYFHLLVMS